MPKDPFLALADFMVEDIMAMSDEEILAESNMEEIGMLRDRTLAKLALEYDEESRAMLRCADLNPRETGSSIYAQRAVECARIADALHKK